MPTIRLADIPNAPGPSELAGITPNSVVRGSRSVLDQTLELDAFSQEARAAGRFADAVQGIGNVALQWSQKFAEAKDTADLARADTIMRSVWEKQQNEQLELAPEEWNKAWSRNLEDAKRQLGEIRLSNNANQRLAPSFEKWSQISGIQIAGQSRKKQLDVMESDVALNFNTRMAQDDFEGAFQSLQEAEKTGAIRKEVANSLKAQASVAVERKAKSERNANIESAIILDPQKWERDLTGGLETGSSKLQTDLTKEEMLRFLGTARQQSRFAEVDKLSRVEDLLLKGEFQSVEELEKALDRPDLMPNVKLPERAVQSLKAAFFQTPEQIEHGRKLGPAVKHKIDAYDPADDPSFAGRYELIRDIHSLPEGYREDLRDELREKISRYKESRRPIPSTPISTIKKMAKEDLDQGRYGKWNLNDDKIVPDDQLPAREAAHFRYDLEMTELDQWEKANPEKARDPVEARKAFNDIITRLNKQDAAAGRPSTRRPVDIPSISTPPANPAGVPDPDEVLRSAPAGASAPATIRHNNPGAIYPSGLASKYGSTGSSTIGGGHKIASFRTPTDGAAAQFAQLNRPQYLGKPLREAIRTWSGGNSVESYLATIQREAGLSPDTVLTPDLLADPSVAIPLAKAMARHETGSPFPLDDDGWRQAHSRVFST
jgi:hypothetical protein